MKRASWVQAAGAAKCRGRMGSATVTGRHGSWAHIRGPCLSGQGVNGSVGISAMFFRNGEDKYDQKAGWFVPQVFLPHPSWGFHPRVLPCLAVACQRRLFRGDQCGMCAALCNSWDIMQEHSISLVKNIVRRAFLRQNYGSSVSILR